MRLLRAKSLRLAPPFVPLALACVAVCGPFTGCASPKYTTGPPPETAHQTLSEGYALLHTLMAQNQRVAGIFMLKGASDDFKALIQEIARACSDARKRLEEFAESDPMLSLEGANLPKIEVETRSEIEKTVSRELLDADGTVFEKRLAIEQIKATRYASHLAKTLAAIDPDSARVEYLNTLEATFSAFHDQLQMRVSVD